MVTNLMPLNAMLALASGTKPANPPAGGTVVASVANSEWTRSGEVSLDLRTGRYRLTHAPSRFAPDAAVPTTRSRLAASELEPIRRAYAAARAQGLVLAGDCSAGTFIISNGGPDHLVLTDEGRTLQADLSFGCVTEAALALGNLLEATFGHRARPPGR